MFIINENEREYRFGESGPKYLMKGPRMNFALDVLHAVHDDIHLALQDEEILFHDIVVMGLEVLAGAEAHQGEVHPGALHEILGAARRRTR